MTIARSDREGNQRAAFAAMMQSLGDRAIDTTLFDPGAPPFEGEILRTTWEELARLEYVAAIGSAGYRLTPKGWLLAVELSGMAGSGDYTERLGRLLATMKRHVKPRKDSATVPLRQLADESGEPEGWIFNVIDSGASESIGSGRTGAGWFGGERGRLVEIPVDFNLEPADIASALTVPHLEKIEELKARLEEVEEDRAQFHCPYCDAAVSSIGHQDYPEHHCIVTYQSYECGFVTGDGHEESPCPYGPRWPQLDEFDFVSEQSGSVWFCHAVPKTPRAQKVYIMRQGGRTKEEAEARAKKAVAPRKKGEKRLPDWLSP